MELSYDESVKTLREWRNSNVRRSKEIVEIGEKVCIKKSIFNSSVKIYLSKLQNKINYMNIEIVNRNSYNIFCSFQLVIKTFFLLFFIFYVLNI